MDELLFVSPRFLFPADSGGKIRTTQVLKGLRGGRFRITLVSPAPHGAHARYARDLDSICDDFQHWDDEAGSLTRRAKRYASVLSDLPVSVASDRSAAGTALVARCLARKPAVAVFDFPHAAVLAPAAFDVPCVLFTHNVESWIFERHAVVAGNPLTRMLWAQQHRKMLRYERRTLQRFDTIVAVSEKDAAWFRDKLGRSNVQTIPTGVDLDYFAWARPGDQTSVVFTGSMDWPANRDGIEFFLHQVWPKIVAQVPQASMKVIGRSPPAALVAKAPKNWEFTGFVDDIRPHAHGAALSVIPLRVGGGTRIKAYEAMAMGLPVVSTAIGVEGLPVEEGRHYLRADDADGFAQAVVSLLRDRAFADVLSRQARAFVESKYSNREVAKAFEAICSSVAR
jgi:polysaccharide biosynthesis protein PslH